jgi:hypothetical protein
MMDGAYTVLQKNSEGKMPIGRPKCRWNTKKPLRHISLRVNYTDQETAACRRS